MIAPILWKRLPHLSLEEIMTIAGVQLAELSETRAYQDILAMGREEGRQEGGQREAARLVLRLLLRRFGSLHPEQAATIGALPTSQLESLGDALLDFGSAADLSNWLAGLHSN
jgi:predicted transposase YdaD